MFKVSKALLTRAEAALDMAVNRDEFIVIEGTGMILCPLEKQPENGFYPFGYIKKDGRAYAFGPLSRAMSFGSTS